MRFSNENDASPVQTMENGHESVRKNPRRGPELLESHPALGPVGREFESRRSDHFLKQKQALGRFSANTTLLTEATVSNGQCAEARGDTATRGYEKHGLFDHPLYGRWRKMRMRCFNPSDGKYPAYGARGIRVCDEWNESFQAFYDWAIANGWQPHLTIERKDNDGNYCPENCCWASRAEQARNRSNTSTVEIGGFKLTAAEWSRVAGLTEDVVAMRYSRGIRGFDLLQAARGTPKRNQEELHALAVSAREYVPPPRPR